MDRPLLVSAPLIKPILEGRKTLTSRLRGLDEVNVGPGFWDLTQFKDLDAYAVAIFKNNCNSQQVAITCPYGGLGSLLWVREGWYVGKGYDGVKPRDLPVGKHLKRGYLADEEKPDWAGKGRAGIHMPRHISRATLMLTGLACERVQAISEIQAEKEGVPRGQYGEGEIVGPHLIGSTDGELGTYFDGFKYTWINLNGRESWESNPWVWRLYFNLIKPTT